MEIWEHEETPGVHTRKDHHAKWQQEVGHLPARERGFRRNLPVDTIISDFQALVLSENKFLLVKPPA